MAQGGLRWDHCWGGSGREKRNGRRTAAYEESFVERE